jgi:glycosyltransferase involved in cell wall biosynthesis
MKEIVQRPAIYRIWKNIEKKTVPSFDFGYTVNQPIAEEFRKMYNRDYGVIMNVPVLRPLVIPAKKEKYILYQGAVNEGRSFETLIPAMEEVNAKLIIAGDGNLMKQTQQLVRECGLENKISFVGKVEPSELIKYTVGAYIGVTLFENKGLSNYFSLANRFFDYFHSGVPQLCVDYPVYRELNKTRPVAVLTADLGSKNIAQQLNLLLENDVLYKDLQQNCLYQREVLNWQNEERKLLAFYKSYFSE